MDAYEVKKHKYFKDVNWDDVYNRYLYYSYFRKFEPPIPQIKHRPLQLFSQPRVFEDNNGEFMLNTIEKPNFFDGWSFVNNIDNHANNSMNNYN